MRSPLAWIRERRARRRSQEQAAVISALWRTPGLSGYPLAKQAGLGFGRVYVVLARLERDGWITSEWADEPYPRRRLYRVADRAGL